MVPADWDTTFEDTYVGSVFSGFGISIPYVDGLTYVGSLSTTSDAKISIDNNANEKLIKVNNANTASYDQAISTYNNPIATLYYRITGDVDATYNLTIADAGASIFKWDGSANATPKETSYKMADFNLSGCTVKPEVEEPEEPVVTDPYTLSAAAAGNEVDGQKTYYTTVTVNTAKEGARFQVVKDSATTKSWALPAICGSGSFIAIVGTNNETGTFANSIIDGTGVVSNVVEYAAN